MESTPDQVEYAQVLETATALELFWPVGEVPIDDLEYA